MARKELLHVLSKTLSLFVLANADFSRPLIDECANIDLAHLDQYVSATLNTSTTQGNRSGPVEGDTGSLGQFGSLETDWTRLRLLRDALPEDSIIKPKFNHVHRLLLVAHEEASRAKAPASRFREFPAGVTGSTIPDIVEHNEDARETTAPTESAGVTGSTIPDIVEDDEDARETTAPTESSKSLSHEEGNMTAVSSYRDAGFTPSSTTLETSSSTRNVDDRSLATQANIIVAEIPNETITQSSSQENATPVSLDRTSSSISSSLLRTPNEIGYSYDGESRKNPYGESVTTRSQSSTTTRTDKIDFVSPMQISAISTWPSSLAEHSSSPILLTSPYTKDQSPTSTIVEVLDAKTQKVIKIHGWSRIPVDDVPPETSFSRFTTTVQPTSIVNPMSMSDGESPSWSKTTRTPENAELPIPSDKIQVVSKAKEALSIENQTWSTSKVDDRVDRHETRDKESSSVLSPTEPTNTENDEMKTSHEKETEIHRGEKSILTKWPVLVVKSTLDKTDQPFEQEHAELTELRKIDAQETTVYPPTTSHEADGSTSNSMNSNLPSSTGKTLEKGPTGRRYKLVKGQSTSLIDLEYTSSVITSQHIQHVTVANFLKNALRKSSSRIKEISRDYKHAITRPGDQLGETRNRIQPDLSQGIVYELGVNAENRTTWRHRLDQQSPPRNNMQILAGASKNSVPATIFSPRAYRKQETFSTATNLHILDESSTRSSRLGRTNKLRPRRRGSSGDIGKRFRSFYAQEQFEDRRGSRGKAKKATKIKVRCKNL